MNPPGAEKYVNAVARSPAAWESCFVYQPRDMQIFYLTRRLSALQIDRKAYKVNFGSDPLDDFPGEFAAMTKESLIEVKETSIEPTPRGMFYADSIAMLWAWKHLRASRKALLELRQNSSHMG